MHTCMHASLRHKQLYLRFLDESNRATKTFCTQFEGMVICGGDGDGKGGGVRGHPRNDPRMEWNMAWRSRGRDWSVGS